MTDTLLAQPAGKFLPATPTCVSTSKSHHVKICHLCHRIFVSDDKLFDHMKETHPGSTGRTREELIEDETSSSAHCPEMVQCTAEEGKEKGKEKEVQ